MAIDTSNAEEVVQHDHIDRLNTINLTAAVELGRSRMTLDAALSISEQSLIELDKQVDDAIDITINGQLFARGEVVMVDEHFGVRITEIIQEIEP